MTAVGIPEDRQVAAVVTDIVKSKMVPERLSMAAVPQLDERRDRRRTRRALT